MKRTLLIVLIVLGLAGGVWGLSKLSAGQGIKNDSASKSQATEMTFYYLDTCSWCNKVKTEGTIEKIEALGVKVTKIDAAVGPIRHKFQGIPTFVIKGKVYSGYKTFEELRDLLGYSEADVSINNSVTNSNPATNTAEDTLSKPEQSTIPATNSVKFIGNKGAKVVLADGTVKLKTSLFSGTKARFYNVKMPNGKTVYFFVVKDQNGIYRAAANACQVCFGTGKGFHQEGNEIVCNNCGNRYPIEKIATEKGGCNPGPINPNIPVQNGELVIQQADLEQVANFF